MEADLQRGGPQEEAEGDPRKKSNNRSNRDHRKWITRTALVVVQIAVASNVQRFLARLYAMMLPFLAYSYSPLRDMGKTSY